MKPAPAKLPPITEAQFLRQVLQLAKLFGWKSFHQRPGMTRNGKWASQVQGSGVGFPDLILCRGTRIIAAELKRDEKAKATAAQHAWLQAFHDAGAQSDIWFPEMWDEIVEVLR